MELQFFGKENKKYKGWVEEIWKYVIKEKYYFAVAASIFHTNHQPNKKTRFKKIIEIELNSNPRLKRREDEEKKAFVSLISRLYKEDHETLKSVRSEFIEKAAEEFGPFFISLPHTKKYIEPRIEFEGKIVGDSNHDFDVVFYNSSTNDKAIELIECKANLNSFVSYDIPLNEDSKDKDERKLLYIKAVGQFFREKGKVISSEILLLTYTLNTDLIEKFQPYFEKNKMEFVRLISCYCLTEMKTT